MADVETRIVATALALWIALGWVELIREAIRCGADAPGSLSTIHFAAISVSADAGIRPVAIRLAARGPPE